MINSSQGNDHQSLENPLTRERSTVIPAPPGTARTDRCTRWRRPPPPRPRAPRLSKPTVIEVLRRLAPAVGVRVGIDACRMDVGDHTPPVPGVAWQPGMPPRMAVPGAHRVADGEPGLAVDFAGHRADVGALGHGVAAQAFPRQRLQRVEPAAVVAVGEGSGPAASARSRGGRRRCSPARRPWRNRRGRIPDPARPPGTGPRPSGDPRPRSRACRPCRGSRSPP